MKLLLKIKKRDGFSQYLATTIGLAVLFTALALVINVYPVFVARSGIQDVATETARYIELRGKTGSEATAEFQRLCNAIGIDNASLSIDGIFLSDGKRLQLQSEFKVFVSVTYPMGSLSIPLTAKATGRSEVYWKN